MKPLDTRDIAIAHRGEHTSGGAEQVAWELQRAYQAPLYVGYRDASTEPEDVDQVRGLFDGRLARWAVERGGLARDLAYLSEWKSSPATDRLRKHDTLITSGLETLLYCGPDWQTRVHYTHHTGRRQTDLFDAWPDSFKGRLERLYSDRFRRELNYPTNRPDLFVANSEVIAHRIHKYWGVPEGDIRVVYPPVGTHRFSDDHAETEDVYLTLGRLDDWHKHISEIIEAFRGTNRRLLVAGDGPDRDSLERLAGETVEFLGYVDEERKRELLSKARAFVFAGEQEDFGIATAEALASGTPVIAPGEGFSQYQIRPGEAGLTFERGGLLGALRRFEERGVEWSPAQIERHAERFSVEAFRTGMDSAVDEAEDRAAVNVSWSTSGLEPTPRPTPPITTDGGNSK